ncbi:MAG TPA: ABC transporter substrate-binding protein [Jiangellaceae bacterium]|nr:ABC transporter substrate-binding protein [Jiangellaceae bacterium]
MRIVSLLPSTTEILFALGAGDEVVGVTFECDFPPEARNRRIVSTSALPEGLDPADIDAAVAARMAAGEDLYHLDAGALADLDADVVVTQDLCAVCAVDVTEVDDALDYLGCRAQVVSSDPHRLGEVLDSVTVLGEVVDAPVRAKQLVDDLQRRLDEVTERCAGRRKVPTLVLEWTEPPFAPGHWVPDMIEHGGGANVLGQAGQKSARTDWDAVAAAKPEVIISAPCGYELETSAGLTEQLLASGVLPPDVPVWAVDANASFARPGPRLVDGVEAIAGMLHPEVAAAPEAGLAVRLR